MGLVGNKAKSLVRLVNKTPIRGRKAHTIPKWPPRTPKYPSFVFPHLEKNWRDALQTMIYGLNDFRVISGYNIFWKRREPGLIDKQ